MNMTQNFSECLEKSGATLIEQDGILTALRFGSDIGEEVQALRRHAGVINLSHWGKITIRGPERKAFLHGLVSNEVQNLPAGQVNHSLMLTPQGKVVAELWVVQREAEIVLLTQSSERQTVLEKLDKYLIMEEAEISDGSQSWGLFSVHGPKSAEVLKKALPEVDLPDEGHAAESDAAIVFAQIARTGEPGYELLIKPGSAAELWKRLLDAGAKPVGTQALEVLRVESGIPRCGKELDNTVIPQEAHLDDCLSYEKGCYVGQETVGRLHFRGHVNRELTAFIVHSDTPAQGIIELAHEGKNVGKVTSSVFSPAVQKVIGLGFLRCKLREPGRKAAGTCQGERISVTVAEKPLVSGR